MTYDDTDDIETNESEEEVDSLAQTKGDQHSAEVRKRIDDLLERKRLKELLDDSDDWDI